MAFPSQSLEAVGGRLYATIHENRLTGLPLGLYWSLTTDFAPLEYANEEWECSLVVEWLRFGVQDWRSLDDEAATSALGDQLVEASFYLFQHDRASVKQLSLVYIGADRFRARVEAVVEFGGLTGDDANPALAVTADAEIEFEGLVVVADNLFPKPNTPALVVELARRFADLSAYEALEHEGFRYLLRPTW